LQQNAPTVIEGVVIRDKMRLQFLREYFRFQRLYFSLSVIYILWGSKKQRRRRILRLHFALSDGRRLLAVICGRRRFRAASVFIYSF
jgi:hypothetical protein